MVNACNFPALVLIAGWALLLNTTTDEPGRTLVLLAPAAAVITFGAYLLIALLYGVATFRTVPEEAVLLQQDIARAKGDLKRRGIQH
ncbi:hypothetical protein D9Q98_007863 [Chlorella vulgaris]|uniref:Dolichol-phosphate mannosyltransferase subunit 3 n=1 Tax=Chlorella vulgaris TaxID=3077 RepID=A0A9D4THT8_CHLVU|nr:hypothetical protein D9Q98_007863 [Chlorella vulgaris]